MERDALSPARKISTCLEPRRLTALMESGTMLSASARQNAAVLIWKVPLLADGTAADLTTFPANSVARMDMSLTKARLLVLMAYGPNLRKLPA